MRRGQATAFALVGVAAALLDVVGGARAQVRLVTREPTEFEQHTHLLPWRRLQRGEVAIENVTNPCPPSTADAPAPAGPISIRVLRGRAAPNCVFHDLVRIDFKNSRGVDTHCSGVLVSDSHVLTAGHCACGLIGSYVVNRHLDFDPAGGRQSKFKTSFVLTRPPALFDGFSCGISPEETRARDLALLTIEPAGAAKLRLGGAANLRLEGPSLVNIATPGQIIADFDATRRLIVAGYGETSDGSFPDMPHFAAIPIASMSCAHGHFAGSLCRPFGEFVLAAGLRPGDPREVDSCVGDSGSPIFYMPPLQPSDGGGADWMTKAERRSIMLVGIASRALRGVRHVTASQCGGGGIYTSVGDPEVLAWLRSFGILAHSQVADQKLDGLGSDVPDWWSNLIEDTKVSATHLDFIVNSVRRNCENRFPNKPEIAEQCTLKIRKCLDKEPSVDPEKCAHNAASELAGK